MKKIEKININLKCPGNVTKAIIIYKKNKPIKQLKNFFSEIKIIEKKMIYNKIQEVINKIQQKFKRADSYVKSLCKEYRNFSELDKNYENDIFDTLNCQFATEALAFLDICDENEDIHMKEIKDSKEFLQKTIKTYGENLYHQILIIIDELPNGLVRYFLNLYQNYKS